MTIVEIGSGLAPAYLYSRVVNNQLRIGATYIGIDVDIAELEGLDFHRGIIHAVAGDLASIPLDTDVADEVWLLNVFSGKIKTKPNVLPGGPQHFSELTRILKLDGRILIGETLTTVRDVSWLINESFSSYGLSKRVYQDKELHEFINQYGIRFDSINIVKPRSIQPFFIALTKVAPTPTLKIS